MGERVGQLVALVQWPDGQYADNPALVVESCPECAALVQSSRIDEHAATHEVQP